MAGHQVQQDVHLPLVGGAEQFGQIPVGAVARGHLFIVPHIIACVLEGRIEAGIDPQGVAPQVPDIIQPGRDAGQIPDAVAVAVAETLRVDLVKNSVFQPLLHSYNLLSGRSAAHSTRKARQRSGGFLLGLRCWASAFFFILSASRALVNRTFHTKHSFYFLLFAQNFPRPHRPLSSDALLYKGSQAKKRRVLSPARYGAHGRYLSPAKRPKAPVRAQSPKNTENSCPNCTQTLDKPGVFAYNTCVVATV